MADATGSGTPPDSSKDPNYEDKVEKLALKLLRGGTENGLAAGDIASARRAARRILEDSEARTYDPATVDPEDEGVIRRTSNETASSGESTSPRTTHGE
ncbi:MAG: hypothetical protein QOH26_1451 [Actinomycetota bacterium]|nr:hypothetical protein [Actinomycetota bacterium]